MRRPIVWCLFGINKLAKRLQLIYCDRQGFWLDGTSVALAAYQHYQTAYAMRRRALQDERLLNSIGDIIVRKVLVLPLK